MKNITSILLALFLLGGVAFTGCAQKPEYRSPIGYDLSKPVKYAMPGALHEISGIAFKQGLPDMLYTEEDEHGRVYYLRLGDKAAKFTEFKEKGDFEDIAICNDQIVELESKGRLFTMPFAGIGKPTVKAQRFDDILPEGEYEGLYADEKANQLYVLCKHCTIDKTSKTNSGFIFDLKPDGSVKKADNFTVSVKHIEDLAGIAKINFHPSALTRNPVTSEWWILSSVNKMIVVLDDKWKVRQVYKLDPDEFLQPEGITFDNKNNLYISNEGGQTAAGNVLKFTYKGKTSGS